MKGLKAGTETGSAFNHFFSRMDGPAPAVGMGATVLCWTDRHAATIIKVTPKTVTVQRDHAIRIDQNGMSESQTYRYEPNPNGEIQAFRMTRRGLRHGHSGNGLLIGDRREYHDFSF